MTGVLHGRRRESTAATAVAGLSDNATVIAWTSREVHVGRVQSGAALDSNNEPLPLAHVFELRGFDDTREVRWMASGLPRGVAVTVSEHEIDDWLGEPIDRQVDGRIEVSYILAGQVDQSTPGPGWVTLRSGAIRPFAVWLADSIASGGQLALTAMEYTAADSDGNVDVVDERLTGIRVVP
jgi:CRISPR-associated protein (TIGR03984 family)